MSHSAKQLSTVAPFKSRSTEERVGSQRFTELDALRGIAALVVVFGHYGRMWGQASDGLSLGQIVRYPLVAAHESVSFFFLLSGFFLAVPLLKGQGDPSLTFPLPRAVTSFLPYLPPLALGTA